MVLGWYVGGWVVSRTPPTEGDVRSAARSLVPSGFTVVSEKLDADEAGDVWFLEQPYAVELDVEGGGTPEDRRTAFRQQALAEGWETGEAGASDSADLLRLERGDLRGSVIVGGEGGLSKVVAARQAEPSLWPMPLCAVVGGVLGLALCWVGRLLLRRP